MRVENQADTILAGADNDISSKPQGGTEYGTLVAEVFLDQFPRSRIPGFQRSICRGRSEDVAVGLRVREERGY